MKPLLYLASRSVVNGVRRSFQTPMRALATTLFVAMQLWWLSRVFFGYSGTAASGLFVPTVGADATELIVTLGFCFLAFVSWSTVLTLFQPPMTFQMAEVDVLIPTPVSARTYLMWNFLKGYLARLLWPLFMLFFAARPFARITRSGGLNQLDITALSSAFKTATLAYLVMQLAWAAWRYASGLVWTESDQRAQRLRTIASWVCSLGGLAYMGTIIYRVAQIFRQPEPNAALIALSRAPDVQFILYPAVAAIKLGAVPLTGDVQGAFWGFGFLAVMTVAGFVVMLARAPKVFEVASRMAVARAELKQRRTGDAQGQVNLLRARSGKLKARRLGWLSSMKLTGDAAFWWKELVVLSRSAGGLLAVVILIPGLFAYLSYFLNSLGRVPTRFVSIFPSIILAIGPLVASGQGQQGFREFLKKGELLRPLPLKTSRLLFVEAFSKVIPMAIIGLLSLIALSSFLPDLWVAVMPTWLTMLALGSFGSVASLFLAVLLPDMNDPAQNMFRRLVQGLGLTIVIYGSAILYGFLSTVNILLAAGVVLPIAVGLTAGCLVGAGRTYQNFNPAD